MERTVEPMKVYKYGANVDTDVIIPALSLIHIWTLPTNSRV